MISAPPLRLRTLGVELDPSPERFGFLRDTPPGADEAPTLRGRMEDDG